MKKIWLFCIALFMVTTPFYNATFFEQNVSHKSFLGIGDDVDPLVDLSIDVVIKRVRTIDIDINQPPSIVVKVIVNEENWQSETFQGFDIMNLGTAHFDIPDDEEKVIVTIDVMKNGVQADVSSNGNSLQIIYDVLTGAWNGDDWLGDESGYGHAGGHEDGVVNESDCEIWFDIVQNDYDGDGLTYWEEVNVYGTDPTKSDLGKDYDNDGVPIEWEDKWGYDPFKAENHSKLDPDKDGLQNVEEWQMQEWFADPFRQDIYIENDYMEEHNGIKPMMPEESLQLQYSAFTKHNIMLLVDNGLMGGSEEIPYEELDWDKLNEIYNDYFLHNDENNPRKGIFHYAIIIHDFKDFGRGVAGFNFKRDAFAVCSAYIQKWRPWENAMKIAHGGAYMHELGHQLGLPHLRVFPWQLLYWLSWNYKSCMNYRYTFKIVDYSDGSHGFMDRNEWDNLDLSRFER
ncbi:MAG: hypothetical protein DRN29_01235 [Thermoplasmata archaeon]|nr:MAG: hypothetical protein DRN29_01235 [Thermoplasmata archaeon]